ncbi:glycosyl transferase family 2 [Modicisalibacter xianhensis]|uniref:Glycosyl transferase family 2 n=1 Tax=Modicisalibacter xianhensis TaxID=442341 RepID=A0A4R8FYJ6_9GAMM|nr:glycosyltransferase family 2 protein [Halomonas xianhensis]TDX32161.1 glycosyl transferase family 2 [Halomonas xianhensis]
MLVSIVTPLHNSAKTAETAILSVKKQTLIDWEMILVDDFSNDNTLDIVLSCTRGDPRFKIVKMSKNVGAGEARNAAIEEAKGRYISFLDSDDFWLPDKLYSQINFMESHKVALSYGDYTEMDIRSGKKNISYKLPSQLSYYDLLGGCPIGCLTAAYNQEYLGKKYMPLVRRGQDWGLWLDITRSGEHAIKYPGNHAVYNISPNSLSGNKIKKMKDIYEIYRVKEGLNSFSSLWHLCRHVKYVRSKRI